MTGPRLLVVDDDDIVGFAVADYFRHRGVAVTLVTTCGAALVATVMPVPLVNGPSLASPKSPSAL